MLTPIEVIYQSLGIRQKLQDQKLRVLYLREVWGLEQKVISLLEGIHQPRISKILSEAKLTHSEQNVKNLLILQFDIDEIKYLHQLPRDVLTDTQLVGVVNNILGIEIRHPFYGGFIYNNGLRIAALSSLGVRQQTLAKIFKLGQSGISMSIKRNAKRCTEFENQFRYDTDSSLFKISPIHPIKSRQFQLAGGQQNR